MEIDSESSHDSDTDFNQSVEVADQQKESAGISEKATASGTKLLHLTLRVRQDQMEFDCDGELTGFRFILIIDCELFVQFVTSLLCPGCKKALGASRISSTEDRTDLTSQFRSRSTFKCFSQKLRFVLVSPFSWYLKNYLSEPHDISCAFSVLLH